MATPWSPAELLDIELLSWTQFREKYPHRTYDSYEVKRRRVKKDSAGGANRTGLVTIPTADGWVGPTIGYFDFETTFSTRPRVLTGAVCDGFGETELYDLDTHPGVDWLDDSRLVAALKARLEEFDILVGWNSKLFDVPVLNGRLNQWRVRFDRDGYPEGLQRRDFLPFDPHMHIDLMYYASGQFNRIGRRSLANVSETFDSPNRKTPLNVEIWDKADHGDRASYDLIREHNVADVKVTRDVYSYLGVHIRNIHR